MLRMFCSGCSSFARVGRESIWGGRAVRNTTEPARQQEGKAHHLDGRIGQIDKLGQHFAILAGGVKLCGVPQGQDGADELSKAFRPSPVLVWTPLYVMRSAAAAISKGEGDWHTSILVVELEEVALLVELVGVTVEKRKDGEQFGDGVLVDLHEGRLVGEQHGRRSGGVASPRSVMKLVGGRDCHRTAIIRALGRRGRGVRSVDGLEDRGRGDLLVGEGRGGVVGRGGRG